MEVVVIDNWTTGATSRAKLQSNHHQQTNIQFFTGRMPFLSPNQQCQSTEVKVLLLRRHVGCKCKSFLPYCLDNYTQLTVIWNYMQYLYTIYYIWTIQYLGCKMAINYWFSSYLLPGKCDYQSVDLRFIDRITNLQLLTYTTSINWLSGTAACGCFISYCMSNISYFV